MSQQQKPFSAGQAYGQGQAKTEEWIESAQNTANLARDKTAGAAQATSDCAQRGRDDSAGFLQQTGEQVMNMAQGAVDTVKNTLGVGEQKK